MPDNAIILSIAKLWESDREHHFVLRFNLRKRTLDDEDKGPES